MRAPNWVVGIFARDFLYIARLLLVCLLHSSSTLLGLFCLPHTFLPRWAFKTFKYVFLAICGVPEIFVSRFFFRWNLEKLRCILSTTFFVLGCEKLAITCSFVLLVESRFFLWHVLHFFGLMDLRESNHIFLKMATTTRHRCGRTALG